MAFYIDCMGCDAVLRADTKWVLQQMMSRIKEE